MHHKCVGKQKEAFGLVVAQKTEVDSCGGLDWQHNNNKVMTQWWRVILTEVDMHNVGLVIVIKIMGDKLRLIGPVLGSRPRGDVVPCLKSLNSYASPSLVIPLFCVIVHQFFISKPGLINKYILQPSCTLTLPRPVQDWLWGTPITNSEGTKILYTTSCSRGYCHCQLWYADSKSECRFTVSQDLAQRDQQCTCNRQG